MKIDDKISNEKLQYDINRKEAKVPALSHGKIDKYEYLTGEKILLYDQIRVIEQFNNLFSFRKRFGKTNKNKRRSRQKANKSI